MEEIIEGSRQLRDLGFGDRPSRGGAGGKKHAPAGTKTGGSRDDYRRGRPYRTFLEPSRPHGYLAFRRIRTPGGSVSVNYTEVLLLMQDGTEVPAKLLLKDTDLDLAYVLPIKEKKNTKSELTLTSPAHQNQRPSAFGRGRIFGQTGQKPLQTIDFEKGWVNAVIEKPRSIS